MLDQSKAKMATPKPASAPAVSASINMVKLDKRTGVFRIPVTDKWTIAGSTQVKIRSSRTTLCVLGMLCLLIATGVVLNFRIHKLEAKNSVLEGQLGDVKVKLGCLMSKLSSSNAQQTMSQDCVEFEEGLTLLSESQSAIAPDLNQEDDVDADVDDSTRHRGKRVRKSVDVEYRGQTQNGHDPDTHTGPWNASSFSAAPPLLNNAITVNPAHRKRERGNVHDTGTDRKSKSVLRKSSSFQKAYYLRLKSLREKDQSSLKRLRIKLEIAKERAKSAKSLLSAYHKQDLQAVASRNFSTGHEARAAYLTVRDTTINILNPKQHIGPWHLTEDARTDLGFNDLWYQNLSLDDNGTSVIFQEAGLYLIYAQVYYKSTQTKKDKAAALGFKIYLQKKPKVREVFRRAIPISECVAAYPSYYQTCFTQICWYVEEGDQVYLEHFTEARPVIEAENQGQTFLGIVRLSH